MSNSPGAPRPTGLHPAAVAIMAALFFVVAFIAWRASRGPDVTEEPEERPRVILVGQESLRQLPPLPPFETDVVLSPTHHAIPGEAATEWLYYRNAGAAAVHVAGSWDHWSERHPMVSLDNGLWALSVLGLDAEFGRYEFKFIVDSEWEPGENRMLHLNEEGFLERPPLVVAQTLIEDPRRVRVLLHTVPEDRSAVRVEMEPDYGVARLEWRVRERNDRVEGFRVSGDEIEFVFDPGPYNLSPASVRSVNVAGTFNAWNPEHGSYRMQRQADGTWTHRVSYAYIDGKTTDEHIMFKFVVNGEWRNPPQGTRNAMLEPGTTHMNLTVPRGGAARPELWIHTRQPIDLREPPTLTLRGLHPRTLREWPTPGAILYTLKSDKPMGVTLDREHNQTHYRLFAPRATFVELGLFDGPYHTNPAGERVDPVERVPMQRDDDGVWELTRDGLNTGQYYAFRVEGPRGLGEGFSPNTWKGDPYAYAVSLAEGNSIVVDLEATNELWQGWSEAARNHRIPWEDMVIYETHVRHFTWDPSSNVPEDLRGTYMGFLATEGLGTGLDHLKELGVNVIQFMPIHEFPNGFVPRHDWGYATDFFFAPESSFALHPREGSQIHEFRHLVDELKQRGFSVFLDVVYNHIGGVNVFSRIDRKYYFRLNPDLSFMNFSGVGNDVASERPMMRRLIVESVLFWVEEYGIDGFRFDLGELIDDDTLLDIEREIRERHPHVVLHSEPWSFRGHHKDFIGRTSWGAWNDEFREPAKRFVVGNGDIHGVRRGIRGSVEGWARHPLQSVNYMESHDDHSLLDELTSNPNRDGRDLSYRDERVHKLAATLIFTSLGTPMITEGQDWMRSKHGIRNTYNQGDELNALRWTDRERPHAREVSDYYAQMIRFRLSEAGSALRVADLPTLDYVRFVENGSDTALGWIVNANAERPDVPAVMVLMNAGTSEATFQVDLPPGNWGMVGNGDQVMAGGIPGTSRVEGNQTLTLTVPPRTALIYRNGF